MKIQLNKQDQKQLAKLLDMKYLNMEAADFLKDYLDNDYLCVDKESVKEMMTTSSMKEEEAFFTTWLLAKDIAPDDSEIQRLKDNNHLDNVTKLNVENFKAKSNLADMPILEKKQGNWELKYNYYAPYEGFLFNDTYADSENYYAEINSLGFFNEKVPYLTVMEDNVIWMSITPYEINTMTSSINKAHGKVIAFGLGLGYFPFMAMNKENVESVTVIEKDEKAIHLFENEILPKIRLKHKLTILKEDAFTYAKEIMPNENYDYAFFDIYHDASDGIFDYIKMKNLESLSPQTEFSYWIENSLLIYLRRIILTLIEENLSGFTKEDYQFADCDEDNLINSIYHSIEDKEFHSYDELKSFLSDESLREIAKTIKL